jgi:hypothetical protein
LAATGYALRRLSGDLKQSSGTSIKQGGAYTYPQLIVKTSASVPGSHLNAQGGSFLHAHEQSAFYLLAFTIVLANLMVFWIPAPSKAEINS